MWTVNAAKQEEDVSEVLWKGIDSDLAMNYAMLHQLQDSNSGRDNKPESLHVNEKKNQAWQECTDSTDINKVGNESNKHGTWETPGESRNTRSDGYRETCESENLDAYTGYSKINKPKSFWKIVGLGNTSDNNTRVACNNLGDKKDVPIRYQAEVTLSYNQVSNTVMI